MGRSERSAALSRDEVVRAGLAVIARGSVATLTMRAVAAELSVTPMALYYHLEGGKEGLLRLVGQEVISMCAPLHMGTDGWEASLRRHLRSLWEVTARYRGISAAMIDQPNLGVTAQQLRSGLRFFEQAGFSPRTAKLAWSFAMTYVHGRLSVDARLADEPMALRSPDLRARDYVEFGIDAVIAGLRALLDAGPAASGQ